jgi:hypothetical protein
MIKTKFIFQFVLILVNNCFLGLDNSFVDRKNNKKITIIVVSNCKIFVSKFEQFTENKQILFLRI